MLAFYHKLVLSSAQGVGLMSNIMGQEGIEPSPAIADNILSVARIPISATGPYFSLYDLVANCDNLGIVFSSFLNDYPYDYRLYGQALREFFHL